jgi:hypothetical protein
MNWVSLGMIIGVMLAGALASMWANRTAKPTVEVKNNEQK